MDREKALPFPRGCPRRSAVARSASRSSRWSCSPAWGPPARAPTTRSFRQGSSDGRDVRRPEPSLRGRVGGDAAAAGRGLMFRREMAPHEGMLFVFEEEDHRSFWMKNTLLALDLIFIDRWAPSSASPAMRFRSIRRPFLPAFRRPASWRFWPEQSTACPSPSGPRRPRRVPRMKRETARFRAVAGEGEAPDAIAC